MNESRMIKKRVNITRYNNYSENEKSDMETK